MQNKNYGKSKKYLFYQYIKNLKKNFGENIIKKLFSYF